MKFEEFKDIEQKMFEALRKYLNEKKFNYYFEDSISEKKIRGPDIVGMLDNNKVFYEIKSGDHIDYFRVLDQLNQFILEGQYKKGYLVVSDDVIVSKKAKELYKEQGFGIIKLNVKKEDSEPKTILESDVISTEKNVDFFEYSLDLSAWAKYHSESFKFLTEIFLFIICGELLVASLWELIITQNLFFLWIFLPILLVFALIYLYIFYKESRKI